MSRCFAFVGGGAPEFLSFDVLAGFNDSRPLGSLLLPETMQIAWFRASDMLVTTLFAWCLASEVPEITLFAWFRDLGGGKVKTRLTER